MTKICVYARSEYFQKRKDMIKNDKETDRLGIYKLIKGIGEKTEKDFSKLNIFTVEDLIQHYPRGYDAV